MTGYTFPPDHEKTIYTLSVCIILHTSLYDNTIYDIAKTLFDIIFIQLCQRYCYQKKIQEECACFYPFMRQIGTNSTEQVLTPCDITPNITGKFKFGVVEYLCQSRGKTSLIESSEYQCYTRTMNSFNQPNVSCPCNVACYEKSYTSAVTVSTWPSNQYWVKNYGPKATNQFHTVPIYRLTLPSAWITRRRYLKSTDRSGT